MSGGITGPVGATNIVSRCGICTKKIDGPTRRCQCGISYHVKCLADINFCPECGEEIGQGATGGSSDDGNQAAPDDGVKTAKKAGKKGTTGPLELKAMIQRKEEGAVMCILCRGYIKSGMEYARCECGKTYHVPCLKRLGRCLSCGSDIVD